MDNIITIRLHDDDRARLDKIAALLEQLANSSAPVSMDRADTHPVDSPYPVAAEAPQTVAAEESKAAEEEEPQTAAAEENKPEPEETAPAVTIAQIQQKVVKLANGGKRAQVRDIVNAYAPKVSDLPADKLGEVWEKLTALGD